MSALRYVPIEALTLIVLVGLAAGAVAALPALRRGDNTAAVVTAARVLLGGTVLAVIAVTMSGTGEGGVNLTPGAGIQSALSNANRDLGLLNLLGNVVMFAPVGLLAPVATRLRLGGVVMACLALSVSVETLQLTLGRNFDADDILLNTLGGAAGAATGVALLALLRGRLFRTRPRWVQPA